MNWLKLLHSVTEETESPEEYWLWAGLFTVAATLQRKVWIDYGIARIFPNLYVMFVAPPGETRKEAPLVLAGKLLNAVGQPLFADSPTRRAMSKYMAENFEKTQVGFLTAISKELSSFLASDLKNVLGFLTDLYTCPSEWGHTTGSQGDDHIGNICINFSAATTPNWISDNLPQEAIGGGWTSRVIILSGFKRTKLIAIPKGIPKEAMNELINGLGRIALVEGAISWPKESQEFFKTWYDNLHAKDYYGTDDRIRGFISRAHICVLKIAMILCVIDSSNKILAPDFIGQAIDLVEAIIATSHNAFNSYGKSVLSLEKHKVLEQIKNCAKVGKLLSFKHLMKWNLRDLSKIELKGILEEFETAGLIQLYSSGVDNIIIKPLIEAKEEKGA